MASPFSFFRKYSSDMMIVLVILAMLLFTLDGLFSDEGQNLWLLGLLLGGTVFGIAGVGQGRWLQWGLGGAAFGAILGFILPGFVGEGGISTSLGVIDNQEMEDLEIRRAIANQTVMQAFEASFGPGMSRFAPIFGFNHSSTREDVVFGKLLRAEADRIGIAVDPSMVNSYLKEATSNTLKTNDYVNIRNSMSYKGKPLSDELLSEIIGDEIKANMAYQTLRPRTTTLPPGPEVYWQYFKRMNVRQQLNVAALSVDDFTDQVGEPTDADVEALFKQYKTKFPNQVEPGAPGFRLDFRAKLAYLELDTDSVESQVGEVTDADIEAYYNENKESSLIKRTVFPDMETPATPAEGTPAEPATTEPVKAAEGEATPSVETPAKTEATKPDEKTEAPAVEEPAATEPSASPTEEAPTTEPEPAPETPAADGDNCNPFAQEEATTAPDEPSASAPVAQEPAPVTVPAAEVVPSETAVGTEQIPPVTIPDAAPQTPAEQTPAEQTPAEQTPATQTLTIPSDEGISIVPGDSTPAMPEIKFEYRELNDELKAEIREEIIRQRVKTQVDRKMLEAVTEMTSLARDRAAHRFSLIEKDPAKYDGNNPDQQEALKKLRESMADYDAEIASKLKSYASANGLSYAETPLISYGDFRDNADYPIATATEPNDNPMIAAQSAPVSQNAYQGFNGDEQNNDAQLYLVREAQRSMLSLEGGQSRYAYWTVDFSPSHIPKLDEPGVKDSVVMAWKRINAKELVVKRAEELAQKVRDGLAKEGEARLEMAESLKDETTTGKADASALAVRGTMPFSWLKTSSAAPQNMSPQVSMSQIQFSDLIGGTLSGAGDKFMAQIFDEMSDEQVGVVPIFDMSKYYVVHVTNRYPTPEVGQDALLERFATEGKQFGFSQSPMLPAMQQQLNGPASLEWEKSVWRRYDIDLDAEPEGE